MYLSVLKIPNWSFLLFGCSVVYDSLRPIDCITPGFPVRDCLPEFAQTPVQVNDAIQPSHPLSPPSPPAFNLSQLQRLFQWVSSLHQNTLSIGVSASASILPMNIQDWFLLGLTGLISLKSKGLSRVFSNTTVQKHQFFSTLLSLWSTSHIHTRLLEKTITLTRQTFVVVKSFEVDLF